MLNTNQLVNHSAVISPNGRFFAAATFTAEVKIWELQWGKSVSDPVKAVKVMSLQVCAPARGPGNGMYEASSNVDLEE